jgi:hypothetical protein
MRGLVLAALLAAPARPAYAGDPVVLMLENRSGQMIRQLALFPVLGGRVVDDVLMSRHDAVAAGSTVALDTRLPACGPVSLWVQFADMTEATAQTDLCRNRRPEAHP